MQKRCAWTTDDPLYIQYHDHEWGVPVHEDSKLFEMLVLEGMQAGLSWITILRKRENFRKALDQFDPRLISAYGQQDIDRLLNDAGIVRNKLKLKAAVTNAQAFIKVQKEYGSFDQYIWQFVDGEPILNDWHRADEVPASTPLSDKLSRDLKRRGFKFVGSTICYSFMQAVGMVNDHTADCFLYPGKRKTSR
ncbi:DNA-3-methyladenine glycosylase I [Paenibacillus sp. J2TS4]|uniref:DNA-3-methyladenine glycosylase I n=1 Tax=Paenibacillus sp. J2TS4 TaxID=2807194 RepID=UPI001B1193DB|nr:DNA-3-methyladenine glycosylase I [Paenibacillus sp. J2TS4]GIP35726.1 DNA-3-methyladenine glycosylase I [Paenibacillus sp. J2TS4]